MSIITAKQLKQKTGEVIRKVRSGERLTITYRGKPVAVIAPPIKEEMKALEGQLMVTNMVDIDQMMNLKIDIKTDEDMLKDLALSLLMNNEQVELVDKYDNKLIPELRVAFKKIS